MSEPPNTCLRHLNVLETTSRRLCDVFSVMLSEKTVERLQIHVRGNIVSESTHARFSISVCRSIVSRDLPSERLNFCLQDHCVATRPPSPPAAPVRPAAPGVPVLPLELGRGSKKNLPESPGIFRNPGGSAGTSLSLSEPR